MEAVTPDSSEFVRILCGDLNSTKRSVPVRLMRGENIYPSDEVWKALITFKWGKKRLGDIVIDNTQKRKDQTSLKTSSETEEQKMQRIALDAQREVIQQEEQFQQLKPHIPTLITPFKCTQVTATLPFTNYVSSFVEMLDYIMVEGEAKKRTTTTTKTKTTKTTQEEETQEEETMTTTTMMNVEDDVDEDDLEVLSLEKYFQNAMDQGLILHHQPQPQPSSYTSSSSSSYTDITDITDITTPIENKRWSYEIQEIGPIPSETLILEQTAFPSPRFPSDHVPVVVSLNFFLNPHYKEREEEEEGEEQGERDGYMQEEDDNNDDNDDELEEGEIQE